MFKHILLILILSSYISVYSQSTGSNMTDDKEHFLNSNIGKEFVGFYGGTGFFPLLGNIPNYFKSSLGQGGTLSLVYYKSNNVAFYLSINGTVSILKQDMPVDNHYIWEKESEANFLSYGLSVGYSIYNTINWRITPFTGVVLSESKPKYHDMKEDPYLKKYKIGPIPSPELGLNISYRFINKQKKRESSGMSGCGAISTRITYVPFAVYKKGNLYSGGVIYLTIGVGFELFGVH
jgi:hypothetical protein